MKPLTTLIVDDDIDFANMVAASMRAWGHETVVCHNWLTVMVKLKKHDIDLIVADVETPTGNGLSVIQFLSQDPLVAGTPKVFVTGLSDDRTRQQCKNLSADYIHKSSTVMQDLRDYCERHADRVARDERSNAPEPVAASIA